MIRTAYLISSSEPRFEKRRNLATQLLTKIGFNVKFVQFLPDSDPAISNKRTHQYILQQIIESNSGYGYIFEDDINVLEPITLEEIVQYEPISNGLFMLGICEYSGNVPEKVNGCIYGGSNGRHTGIQIHSHPVMNISFNFRGSHAYAASPEGAKALLDFSHQSSHRFLDVILEDYSRVNPLNVCRYDLEFNNCGHKGIFFQDRRIHTKSTVIIL